ncbi:MAG: hypothetical protein O9972_15840 [Burkholderiales bacterium]|jgi:hypothetical protein|nr:hypothetical protein [Burkholderiales bacterium]
MSSSRLSPADAKARADARFAKSEARDKQTEDRIREQAKAAASLSAKTERLRALRLARDAEVALALAAEPPAKPTRKKKVAVA